MKVIRKHSHTHTHTLMIKKSFSKENKQKIIIKLIKKKQNTFLSKKNYKKKILKTFLLK